MKEIFYLIIYIVIIAFCVRTVSGVFTGFGKYEGMTAEEWASEADYESERYEELKSQIDDYVTCWNNSDYYTLEYAKDECDYYEPSY